MTEPLTLSALVERLAEQKPRAIAFIEKDRRTTYAAFADLAQRTAAWAHDAGIGPGSRLAVWLPNRLEWLLLLFAGARLGASIVAVNTRFRSAELTYLLRKSRATWLFLQPDFRRIDFSSVLAGVDSEFIPDLHNVVVVGARGRQSSDILGRKTQRFSLDDLPKHGVDDKARPDAPAIYFTTSGTTSAPKLVEHPQRSLTAHAEDVSRAFGLVEPDTCVLLMVPLCGTFGATVALGSFTAGAPLVIQEAFDAADASSLLKTHAVTHTFGGDDMFASILERCSEPHPFPAARLFGYGIFQPGGQAFAQGAWDRGFPMHSLYGSSELQALLSVQPTSLPVAERVKGGGRFVSDDIRVRVRDIDSGALLPPGGVGELEIRSPRSAFTGYLDNPQATAEAIDKDGFFRTGDLGYVRNDATFVFEARRGDAMRIGGFLVSPIEIEDVLKAIRGVADAQVVGVTIAGKSQPVAFVIAAQGTTPTAEAVRVEAGQVMASFKVPARVWFVDRFPVTESANGIKIQRAKLREMALERLAKETARP